MTLQSATVAVKIAAAICGFLLLAAAGTQSAVAQHDQHRVDAANALAQGDEFARALAASMDKMHRDMMTPSPTGNPDVDFLAAMIPHHAGAVEMARLVLVHGKDPLVRRLAEDIIAGQQTEMAAMQARLNILRQGVDPSPGGYPTLGGTRGTAQ